MIRLTPRWSQRRLRLEFMDGLSYTTIIEFAEPLAGRRGSALDRSAALRASNMKGVLRFLTTTGFVLALCCGCTSIGTHTQQSSDGKGAYSGVRGDTQLLAHPDSIDDSVIGHVSPALVVPYSIIDLPLSAALDTLLLPIDLTYRQSEAPAAIELELQEIKLNEAVRSETPDGPSTVPVSLKITNPRPKAVKLRTGCLSRIVSCADYMDSDGQRWEFTTSGIRARYGEEEVVPLGAHSEIEFQLALLTSRDLMKPFGSGQGVPESVRAPTSLKFTVRDSDVQTDSGAWIPIKGSGTVTVQR